MASRNSFLSALRVLRGESLSREPAAAGGDLALAGERRLPAARRARRALPWYLSVWIEIVRRKPLGTIGGAIVLAMLLAAIFADWLAPYGYAQTNLRHRFWGYGVAHWLGADQLGRDILTRVMYGARVSLYVGLGAVVIGSILATGIGIASGYLGGRLDLGVQRVVDAWLSFPALLLLMTLMSLVGPGVVQIIVVLGVSFGVGQSRVIRGVTLSLKEDVYVEAARALGCGHGRVILQHLLPNVVPTVIIVATVGLSTLILAEASLSFLGLGVPPPRPTWGGMLSLQGIQYMYQAPWMALWPGVALSLAVFGFNMLGDALRDLLDPRLRGR